MFSSTNSLSSRRRVAIAGLSMSMQMKVSGVTNPMLKSSGHVAMTAGSVVAEREPLGANSVIGCLPGECILTSSTDFPQLQNSPPSRSTMV